MVSVQVRPDELNNNAEGNMQTITSIKKWGADRGITINGTHFGQWYKLVSEYGELCDNLAKGKDIRDDIGDMFVVLVMICEIAGVSIERAFELEPQRALDDDYAIIGSIHIDVGSLRFPTNMNATRAADMICSLRALAIQHGHTLEECIEVAYQDIKDRRGFLNADGVFIKEA